LGNQLLGFVHEAIIAQAIFYEPVYSFADHIG
jgi:hypothetical protein